MNFPDDIRTSIDRQSWPISRLNKVISDLMEGDGIEGAVLLDRRDAVIAGGFPKEENYKSDMPEIMSLVEKWVGSALGKLQTGIFAQCILDYNGCKILAKKHNNRFTLLVMLSKRGYIGPAMLDLENSIMKIDEILRVGVSQESSLEHRHINIH